MDLFVLGRQLPSPRLAFSSCPTQNCQLSLPVKVSKLGGAQRPSNDHRSVARCYAAVETETASRQKGHTQAEWSTPHIPAALSDMVVKLEAPNFSAPGGRTEVYLLGMSHVSKQSVAAVRSLIAAVQPEAIVVELCKDRVGLMLNPDGPKGMQLWNSRLLFMSGVPTAEGWPTQEEILSVMETKPRRAFTTPDVEADCVRLLATGLFRSVRPSFKRPTNLDAPQFIRVNGGKMATVPPLGPIEFMVTPRVLPAPTDFSVRIDSSLSSAGIEIPSIEVEIIREKLLAECGTSNASKSAVDASPPASEEDNMPGQQPKQTTPKETSSSGEDKGTASASQDPSPSIDALLRARQSLTTLFDERIQQPFDVTLRGVESGNVEAVVRARRGNSMAFICGLEGSAEGGEGQGIETFKPQRGPLQISSNLRIPNLAKVLNRVGEHAEDFILPVPPGLRSEWRPWTVQELGDAENADKAEEAQTWGTTFAGVLSQTYAKFQNAAGETVGVKPGAAWREALEAASENNGLQVHLGDMPANLTAKNLAQGIWEGLSARLTAAAVVAAVAATASTAHILPSGTEPYAAGSVAAALGLAAVPFLAPLLEVYLFSKKSAEQIEEAVRIKTSLQERGTEMLRLPGEDAIIGWPNAKQNVIDDRDAFMARTIWAAATGTGASPAFILDTSDERHAWHYAMPSNAPMGCSVKGCGAGEFEPVKGARAVVGVVGSAHVGGIVREWQSARDQQRLSELLRSERTDKDAC